MLRSLGPAPERSLYPVPVEIPVEMARSLGTVSSYIGYCEIFGKQVKVQLSAKQRNMVKEEAVSLYLSGYTYTAIADQLGRSHPFITKVVREAIEERYDERDKGYEDQASIEVYRQIMREAWRRLQKTDARSLNNSGLLNTMLRAQERIDKITGVESPLKYQDVDGEIVVEWPDLDAIEPADVAG